MFDFNVALGRFARPGLGRVETADQLTTALRRLGIDGALVCHASALESHIVHGNTLLSAATHATPHLYAPAGLWRRLCSAICLGSSCGYATPTCGLSA